MSIIGGLDVHRAQITFDWIDRDSGEGRRGRIAPATRAGVGAWLGELPGDRQDKRAEEADTIDTVRAIHQAARAPDRDDPA